MSRWRLDHEPRRQYRYLNDKEKWSQDIDGQRIASVTTVQGAGVDALASWSAQRALDASAHVVETYLGGWPTDSLLSFRELAQLSGKMPNDVRDAAGARGTHAHIYLDSKLQGREPDVAPLLSYGLRAAIDGWLDRARPEPLEDRLGLRVERVVGCPKIAVAGTYDAQVRLYGEIHRLDLKTGSTSVKPEHFAQLAAYERLAMVCLESRSEQLTILHADECGNCTAHSIPAYGRAGELALRMFHARLQLYRGLPKLAKKFGAR